MEKLLIITPVKDSIHTALDTMRSVMQGLPQGVEASYTVYNDNSTPDNSALLQAEAQRLGIALIDIAKETQHPSPNYLWVLRHAQAQALRTGAALCIVESDVTLRPTTLQQLVEAARTQPQCGIAAAVTIDEQGSINYPYLHARGHEDQLFETRRHCSFCCSLLTPALLQRYDFGTLNPSKHWYDVTISRQSRALGLRNYLLTCAPVLHRPHQSRPWKLLKYTNPIKYYWLKLTRGLDKI